jgi:hypothetical protein
MVVTKITIMSQALVAHTCNPSYSGGRDQEDRGLKPAWANSFQDPNLKIPDTKQGWWSGSSDRAPSVRSLIQTQILQKKKKKRKKERLPLEVRG